MSVKRTVAENAVAIGRIAGAAIITTVIIIAGLGLVYGEQTRKEAELAEVTLYANLSQACVLALPVDPVTGRDPEDVKFCFTQYGLQAPALAHP